MAEPSPALPPNGPQYDVFMNHAVTEKWSVVSFLVGALRCKGLTIVFISRFCVGQEHPS